ncbi:uncharacterized protein LOC134248745 isoform X2 [Saccostrea cucullata]|uniref:uncharacterized protein LOC134248745 isoform X2 n=1 Tax=Saccostrea cuccullata TaxID=36930 RepID=UPI002ED0FB69
MFYLSFVPYFLKILIISTFFIEQKCSFETSKTACRASLNSTCSVSECPQNKEEFEAAARRKKCHQFNYVNCKPLKYHCILNENLTGLIEVCTPQRYIQYGRCAIFEERFHGIGITYKQNCTYSDNPCPSIYNSTESYKYSQCFKLVNNSTGLYTKTKNDHCKVSEKKTSSFPIWIIIIIVVVLFVVAVTFALIYIICRYKKNKRNKRRQEKEDAKDCTEDIMLQEFDSLSLK